jgi:hypothetical protein
LSTGGDTYDNGVPIVVSGRESLLQGEGEQVMCDSENREVREMRDAVTVLSIIHERGKQGLPLEDIYRQLYNPGLYLMAYGRLYANTGAMTPGSTPEIVDGMSMAKIEKLIDDLRHERYRWTPVRRTYLAKKNGKLRGLGLPTWSDKLLQEVIRLILEAYYEPQFSSHSHGFRPGRGCHTALTAIRDDWSGTKWFIEGDISQYFDTIDHTVLVAILGEKLKDNRFLSGNITEPSQEAHREGLYLQCSQISIWTGSIRMSSECSSQNILEGPKDVSTRNTSDFGHKPNAGNVQGNEKRHENSGHRFSASPHETLKILTFGV